MVRSKIGLKCDLVAGNTGPPRVISSNISKFADDTKIGRQISSEQKAMVLQGELNRMHKWAVKWQMDFNINKCSTLYVGRHNTRNIYTLDKVDIGKSNCEKEVGALVNQDLRSREQCISAKNRANRILGFIARSVSNRSADVIIRPHLDYTEQF